MNLKINRKITDVHIEVGDRIYQSVAGFCLWGKDEDLQNGVSICGIPQLKKYKNVIVPLKYLGNNIFEEEITHKHILCIHCDTINTDHFNYAKCTMDDYKEILISCDLDYESYWNNKFVYPTQQYKKNGIDFEDRLRKVKECCEKYDVTFSIDSFNLNNACIIDSEIQEEYDKVSIQEKEEILKNIYDFSKKCATDTSVLISDALNKSINEQQKLI